MKSDWMYILLDGTVKVIGRDKETDEETEVCEFTTGDCVGELEFLQNHKCVADVCAQGAVRTAKMNRHHFELVMGPVKDVLARNAEDSPVFGYYREQLEKMKKDE